MKTILVDDEILSMAQFELECEGMPQFEIVGKFDRPTEALEYAKNNPVDFALLDVEMPEMTGLELGAKLREMRPDIIIVYVSAYSQYYLDALKQKADYYVLKPYSKEDVEDVLKRAKLLSLRQEKRIFIRTFGSFDVFIDGHPVFFTSAKAKELLALLVDRKGGTVTTEEAFATLWEEKESDDTNLSLYRKVAQRLRDNLVAAGIGEILIVDKSGRSLNMELFDCDYYMHLNGDDSPKAQFLGEYMTNYSWAEMTLGALLGDFTDYS